MPQLMRVLVLIAALCIIAVGLLGSSVGILISMADDTGDTLALVTISISFLLLTTTLGLALAWHAWQAIQNQRSAAFRPRGILPLALISIFILAVVVGQALLSLDLLPVVTFPLFHVTAAVLPPLIVLALVGQSLGGITSWRDLVLQLSSGALLSTPLAFALEAILISGLVVAALVGAAIQPGGQELLQALSTHFQDLAWIEDPSRLAPLLQSPVIMAAVPLVVAGVVPLIEEGIKAVGVGLFAYKRPSRPQAFLWGLACGAGFALVEASFSATSGLEAWALVILLRIGATLLHCFTGALMGLAWYNILARRRWGRGLGLYAGSTAIHALWNGLTAWIAFSSQAALDSSTTATDQMLAGVGAVVLLASLVVLTLGVGLGLLGLTVYVRTEKGETLWARN